MEPPLRTRTLIGVIAALMVTVSVLFSPSFARVATPVATDPKSVVSASVPGATRADPAALSALNYIRNGVWSPDGKQVAYTSTAGGNYNIWITDVQTKAAHALAPSAEAQRWPQWSPDGRRLLFIADKGGDEMYDLFVADVATGHVDNLTQSSERAETHASWSPDGRQVAFSSREKTAAAGELAVVDVETHRVRALTHGTPFGRTNVSALWSPQGDWIYFNDGAYSFSDADVMRIRPDGAHLENLTPHKGDARYRLFAVAPDGSQLLVTSEAKNGWQNVAMIDTRTRAVRWLTDEAANFLAGGFSADGRLVAYTKDFTTDTHVFVRDLRSGAVIQVSRSPGMQELREPGDMFVRPQGSPFSPDGTRVLYLRQGRTMPPVLVSARISDGEEETLVDNPLSPELARAVVPATHVWFKSTDGKFMIPALVWIPPNLRRDGTNPAVVEIHGGPMAQTRPYLLDYIQVLAAQGYLVISPNYRGSINYGRAFFVANRMDSGGGDLRDVLAAADWIAATGYVDPSRIAAYGASNGGYLALMALAKAPHRWAAGVALVPFVDFFTGVASEAPFLQAIDRTLMGEPGKHDALWRDRSPLYYADRIEAPLMMTAGANDPRCPPEQARQMERAIRAKGGVVELTVYGDEGHGASTTDAYADENTRVLNFLNKHVRDTGGSRDSGAPGRQP